VSRTVVVLALFALPSLSHAALVDDDAPASAPTRVAQAKPVVVYVQDFDVDPKLKQDGGGLAATFCGDLAKDKALDVVCAPDVRAHMDIEAYKGLFGNAQAGSAPGLKKRLGEVTVVVTGELRQGKHGVITILSVYDRDRSMGDELVAPGAFRGKVHVKGIAKGVTGVLDRFPDFSQRIATLAKRPSKKGSGDDEARTVDEPNARVIDQEARASD